jgi:hypothetical protein
MTLALPSFSRSVFFADYGDEAIGCAALAMILPFSWALDCRHAALLEPQRYIAP